jgi:dTDP-4-dehydrorhamnose reductase
MTTKKKQPLALIGANGMLASAVKRRSPDLYEIIPFDLPDFDLADQWTVARQKKSVPIR